MGVHVGRALVIENKSAFCMCNRKTVEIVEELVLFTRRESREKE